MLRFPVPARTSRVLIYKPLSSVVEAEYNLALYERVVQVFFLLYHSFVEYAFFYWVAQKVPSLLHCLKPPRLIYMIFGTLCVLFVTRLRHSMM